MGPRAEDGSGGRRPQARVLTHAQTWQPPAICTAEAIVTPSAETESCPRCEPRHEEPPSPRRVGGGPAAMVERRSTHGMTLPQPSRRRARELAARQRVAGRHALGGCPEGCVGADPVLSPIAAGAEQHRIRTDDVAVARWDCVATTAGGMDPIAQAVLIPFTARRKRHPHILNLGGSVSVSPTREADQ